MPLRLAPELLVRHFLRSTLFERIPFRRRKGSLQGCTLGLQKLDLARSSPRSQDHGGKARGMSTELNSASGQARRQISVRIDEFGLDRPTSLRKNTNCSPSGNRRSTIV